MSLSKKEDEAGLNSYYNNKATILQEARVFNESPISPRKCRALLTRIVYLLYIGETFGTQEATTIFFGTTKLFQHKDVRRPLLLAGASGMADWFYGSGDTTERTPPNGLPRDQGAGYHRGGRHHGHQ